jgi:hypothetical protein
MTRKDYPAIASILAAVRKRYAPHWDPNLFRACTDHAVAFADTLAEANPRFDRARFLDDAMVPPDLYSRNTHAIKASVKLTKRQQNAMTVALRHLQDAVLHEEAWWYEQETGATLTAAEFDTLCEAINCGDVVIV